MSDREKFGDYTAVRGKLSHDDSRAAYVTGPFPDGCIRPFASFWFYEEAVRFARERAAEAEKEK